MWLGCLDGVLGLLCLISGLIFLLRTGVWKYDERIFDQTTKKHGDGDGDGYWQRGFFREGLGFLHVVFKFLYCAFLYFSFRFVCARDEVVFTLFRLLQHFVSNTLRLSPVFIFPS